MTVFALLTFVGQALAVVNISCAPMMNESHAMQSMAGMEDMEGMDHSLHTPQNVIDSASMLDTFSDDCCDDVLCSMSHCISSSLFNMTAVYPIDFYEAGSPDARYARSYLAPETVSLFRPPIGH
jgi:hypothetical protein